MYLTFFDRWSVKTENMGLHDCCMMLLLDNYEMQWAEFT